MIVTSQASIGHTPNRTIKQSTVAVDARMNPSLTITLTALNRMLVRYVDDMKNASFSLR